MKISFFGGNEDFSYCLDGKETTTATRRSFHALVYADNAAGKEESFVVSAHYSPPLPHCKGGTAVWSIGIQQSLYGEPVPAHWGIRFERDPAHYDTPVLVIDNAPESVEVRVLA